MFHFFGRTDVKTRKTSIVWKLLAVIGMAAVGVGVALVRRRLITPKIAVTKRGRSIQVRASIAPSRGMRSHGRNRVSARRVTAA